MRLHNRLMNRLSTRGCARTGGCRTPRNSTRFRDRCQINFDSGRVWGLFCSCRGWWLIRFRLGGLCFVCMMKFYNMRVGVRQRKPHGIGFEIRYAIDNWKMIGRHGRLYNIEIIIIRINWGIKYGLLCLENVEKVESFLLKLRHRYTF